jgi:glycosyltransferase involved in cell wall biosynthesis
MNLTHVPLLSIIIPSYNAVENLKNCILSIQKQTFVNYEVIIIDNASTDGTLTYLKKLKPPFYWVSKPDKGIYDAMNYGIEASKGQWLYFLGTDDAIYSSATLKNIFKNQVPTATKLILGRVQFNFSKSDSLFVKKNKGIFTPKWSKIIWIKNTVHHQAVLYKRDIFVNEKYQINYQVLGDYNLNLKLYLKKIPIFLIPEIIASCGTLGVSKQCSWKQYKEEINLKTQNSLFIFYPLFYIISLLKYIAKKII